MRSNHIKEDFMNLQLKEIMSARSVTSALLAEKVGISKVAVSNLVTGKSQPSLDTLMKMADVLNVTISELIGETEFTGAGYILCPHCGKKIKIEKGE